MKYADSMQAAMQRLWPLLYATGCLIFGTVAIAAEDTRWAEQMLVQEAVLTELESRNGPFDPSLVEPLQAMIRLLEEQSEHERIAELQERQLALMRLNLGLESPDLIPLLREMVLTRIAMGAAGEVVDQLQMIRNLSDSVEEPEALPRAIESLAHWYLTGGAGNSNRQRADNFFEARELIEELEDVVHERYGEDDPALVPWLYLDALNLYQLVGLLNSEGGMSGPIIRELVRHDGAMKLSTSARGFSYNPLWSGTVTPVIEEGELVGELYLREGIGKIADMADIFEAAGNLEGQAMAMIYRADFQLLMNRGTAFSQYREARELLLEAGIAEERIKLFFSRPQLLPVSHFYPTLEQAIARQEAELASWRPQQEDAIYVAPFKAWDESAANVREPVSDYAFWEFERNYHQIDLEFRINSRGGVSAVDIIAAEPDDRRSRRLARNAARELRFRPAMAAGRGQRLRDVQMRFLIPRGDD